MCIAAAPWYRCLMESPITNGNTVIRFAVHPIVFLASVLVSTLWGAGCSTTPFPPARVAPMDESRRAAKAVQDREQELAVLRAEMAATRIAAAKQDAELQELRALVVQLRRENGEARQVSLDATRQADARQAELVALKAEREPVITANVVEPTQHDRQLAALEATVSRLTQELAHVKDAMTVVATPTPAKLPKARESKPRARAAASTAQPGVSPERIIPAMHVLPDERRGAGPTQITVQPGDTLWGLARQHHTTIEALRMANGLAGDHVVAGRELRLP